MWWLFTNEILSVWILFQNVRRWKLWTYSLIFFYAFSLNSVLYAAWIGKFSAWHFKRALPRQFCCFYFFLTFTRAERIREFKQTWRRRKRERHLKMWLLVSAIIFQLFKVIKLEKCVLTILELSWNQHLGHKNTKLKILCPRRPNTCKTGHFTL